MAKIDAQTILGDATFYLAKEYPFIKNDVLRQTPERRACELILALKDVIELSSSEPSTNPRRNRLQGVE